MSTASELEKICLYVSKRMLQGADESELREEMKEIGFSDDQIDGLFNGCREGIRKAFDDTIESGVDRAFKRFREEHPVRPGNRFLVRIPALLAGAFLVLASFGGFMEGENVMAAFIVLLLGLGGIYLFYKLRPEA